MSRRVENAVEKKLKKPPGSFQIVPGYRAGAYFQRAVRFILR